MSGNQSNTTEDHLFAVYSLMFIMFPFYILVISLLGIIFNAFVLMVFCLHKKACTVTEIYLSNLAAADLMLVFCLPFWSDGIRSYLNWPFSDSLCRVTSAVISMNPFWSIYFLVMVSIDRYVALVHPLSHERVCKPFYAKLGCLFVWVFGLVFALPPIIYMKVEFIPQSNLTLCSPYSTSPDQYMIYEVRPIIFRFIIPVIIILFCTVKMLQSPSNRLMEGLKPQRAEQKATTLTLAVVLAFLICWLPLNVVYILDVLQKTGILIWNIELEIFQLVSMYLALFSSVLNPILYIIIGKSFQNRTKEFFKQ